VEGFTREGLPIVNGDSIVSPVTIRSLLESSDFYYSNLS